MDNTYDISRRLTEFSESEIHAANADDNWHVYIKSLVSKRYTSDEDCKIKLSMPLLLIIPKAIEYSKIFHGDRDRIRDIADKFEKIVSILDEIDFRYNKLPYIEELFDTACGMKLLDYKDVYYFLSAVRDNAKDDIANFKPGPDNQLASHVCSQICQVYDRFFKEKPRCYNYDRIKETGDIYSGTPYERICNAVSEKFKIELPWNAQKQAAKTYNKPTKPRKYYDE